MRYRLVEIPALLKTPLGRIQFVHGLRHRAWPLYAGLAKLHRHNLAGTRFVSVVGSYGKTTTTRAVLSALGMDPAKAFPWNSWTNVARAVLRCRPEDAHAVIEAGINGPNQMGAYARLIRPDIAVVTAIGSEHNRSLDNLDRTRQEKMEMVKHLPPNGLAVLNGDDLNVAAMAKGTRARVITFGFSEHNDVVGIDPVLQWPAGTQVRIRINGRERTVRLRLIGRTTVYAVLAAAAVASAEGRDIDEAFSALEQLPPTPGRMEPVELQSGGILLRDEFKSSLETVETALDLFGQIPAKRKCIVMGGISEPPSSQGPIYREIGRRMAAVAENLIVVGGNFQPYAAGAKQAGMDRSAMIDAGRSVHLAAQVAADGIGPEDAVLVKGRDTQRLERVALLLQGIRVGCDIEFCDARVRCEACPMCLAGWRGRRVLI